MSIVHFHAFYVTTLICVMLVTSATVSFGDQVRNETRLMIRRGLNLDCGNGDPGNGVCADGSCCSKWGWCGTSPEHCEGDLVDTRTNPLPDSCKGDGGPCFCGTSGDGSTITLNHFVSDKTDIAVLGCSHDFRLDATTLNQQWEGTLNQSGPPADVASSLGLAFGEGDFFQGLEGCCFVCGTNLQIAGKISSDWYCEKNHQSSEIWLKNINKE